MLFTQVVHVMVVGRDDTSEKVLAALRKVPVRPVLQCVSNWLSQTQLPKDCEDSPLGSFDTNMETRIATCWSINQESMEEGPSVPEVTPEEEACCHLWRSWQQLYFLLHHHLSSK